MSTTKKPLKMLWSVIFQDGHIIDQPEDDHYSKHDETAEWNPSSFRDILDYQETSPITWFHLLEKKQVHSTIYAVNLQTGEWSVDGKEFFMDENDINSERKLIYYRNVDWHTIDGVPQDPEVVEYCFGYEYTNTKGQTVKRILTFDGKH